MRLKLKLFISMIIVFFSFEKSEIKAHNNINGDFRDNYFKIINRKSHESKIKVFQNNKN